MADAAESPANVQVVGERLAVPEEPWFIAVCEACGTQIVFKKCALRGDRRGLFIACPAPCNHRYYYGHHAWCVPFTGAFTSAEEWFEMKAAHENELLR